MYERYEELLKLHNVTTADVCNATGISQSTMSNWKKRQNNLSIKNAKLIADYFGVSTNYFLGDNDKVIPDGYYPDDVKEIADFAFENPEYKVLFDATRKVKPEDINFVKEMIERMGRE